MYPFVDDTPPEVPLQDRIFAAAADLQAAYEAGEDFTKDTTLSEAMVMLTVTAVEDTVLAMIDDWVGGPRVPSHLIPYWQPAAPFPTVDELRDALTVMITREELAKQTDGQPEPGENEHPARTHSG